jgi:hypothetical protein
MAAAVAAVRRQLAQLAFEWPPSAAALEHSGRRIVLLVLAPVIGLLLRDIFSRREISAQELKWKRRESEQAIRSLSEVVRDEERRYDIASRGGGEPGTIRLAFTAAAGEGSPWAGEGALAAAADELASALGAALYSELVRRWHEATDAGGTARPPLPAGFGARQGWWRQAGAREAAAAFGEKESNTGKSQLRSADQITGQSSQSKSEQLKASYS